MQKGLDSYQTPAKVKIIATRDLPEAVMFYLLCLGCKGNWTENLQKILAGLDNESRKNVLY
jgi:hypothetical protein